MQNTTGKQESSVGVAVLTHRGRHHLEKCITPLIESRLKPRILVVDSSSDDGTVEWARAKGIEALVIDRSHFNHGLTREVARTHLKTDVVVMMTQDAYPSADALEKLVRPLLERTASVCYGRQSPRDHADFFEQFLREFNYPSKGNVRSLEDVVAYGASAFFCSDAFAAYSNDALDEVGGFPETLSHEDAIVTARLLKAGHRVAYVAEASVTHSHPSNLLFEFRRYFDAGYARAYYKKDLSFAGGDGPAGKKFVRQLLRAVAKKPWLFPYCAVHITVKWLGFKLGSAALRFPPAVSRALSGHKGYWTSTHFQARAGKQGPIVTPVRKDTDR